MNKATNSVMDLLAKSDSGILTKRGSFWVVPGAPNDPSGTNVLLPLEYVPDAEVKKALAEGKIVAAARGNLLEVISVRAAPGADDIGGPALSLGQVGTAEAGTEVPSNFRPEHDAGTTR